LKYTKGAATKYTATQVDSQRSSTETIELANEGFLKVSVGGQLVPVPSHKGFKRRLEIVPVNNLEICVDNLAAFALGKNCPAVLGTRFVKHSASNIHVKVVCLLWAELSIERWSIDQERLEHRTAV
jgi:hypothetical protein